MQDGASTPEPLEPSPATRRSPLSMVVAVAVGLTGLIWVLQGLGILTSGKSFMVGDPKWVVIGVGFIVGGLWLGLRSRRRTR